MFNHGNYEIIREGRCVKLGLFKSLDRILDAVRSEPAGLYEVHKELPRDPSGVRNTQPWGVITKDECGNISYVEKGSLEDDDEE